MDNTKQLTAIMVSAVVVILAKVFILNKNIFNLPGYLTGFVFAAICVIGAIVLVVTRKKS